MKNQWFLCQSPAELNYFNFQIYINHKPYTKRREEVKCLDDKIIHEIYRPEYCNLFNKY